MKDYIRHRLVVDAAHAIALAKQQEPLQHQGVKGRLREVIAQRLLRPWFPPYVGCGTGTIINGKTDAFRQSTQDDLIIYDRTLTPPILIEESGADGIFLNNSVLMRIEIKSTMRAADAQTFAEATNEFQGVSFVRPPAVPHAFAAEQLKTRSVLLAFASDTANPQTEIRRFTQALNIAGTPAAAAACLCVVGSGLWVLRPHGANPPRWFRLKSDDPAEQLACFVACTSSTIFAAHAERAGVDQQKALATGIGLYFPEDAEWEMDAAAP